MDILEIQLCNEIGNLIKQKKLEGLGVKQRLLLLSTRQVIGQFANICELGFSVSFDIRCNEKRYSERSD